MENLIAKYKNKLPTAYIKFISKNERFCGHVDDDFGYVDLWDMRILSEVFELIRESFDSMEEEWFPIGSNGGGETICIKLSSPTKELYFLPTISPTDENADFFCDNFSSLYDAITQCSAKE